jgi:hypothetical protein
VGWLGVFRNRLARPRTPLSRQGASLLVGAAGMAGANGAAGTAGITGVVGAVGTTGAAGTTGDAEASIVYHHLRYNMVLLPC